MTTYIDTSTLTPVRPPRAIHDGTRWWRTDPNAPDRDVRLALAGILPLEPAVRPADTDTHTHDRVLTVHDDRVVETWVEREWTPDELAAREAAANYIDPETRITALERVLVAKDVITDAELEDERNRDRDGGDGPIRNP